MYNKVMMIGKIVTAPELRHTPSGVPVTSFRIVVRRKYVRKGEGRKSDYFDVVCWHDDAEFVQKHFAKSDMIMVEGEMQTRERTDKNGNRIKDSEIVADRVSFTSEKKSVDDEEAHLHKLDKK